MWFGTRGKWMATQCRWHRWMSYMNWELHQGHWNLGPFSRLCGFLKVCVIRLGNTGVRDLREQVGYLTPYNRILNHEQNNPYYLLKCLYLWFSKLRSSDSLPVVLLISQRKTPMALKSFEAYSLQENWQHHTGSFRGNSPISSMNQRVSSKSSCFVMVNHTGNN